VKCRLCRTPMDNVLDHGAIVGAEGPTPGCGFWVRFQDAGFPYASAVPAPEPIVSQRSLEEQAALVGARAGALRLCLWEQCGRSFVPSHGLQIYCSDGCRDEKHRVAALVGTAFEAGNQS
jgi:hypothetical protein